MYALAASAAGVGALALGQPAKAEIIYTPAHVRIGVRGVQTYSLDLNHDGVTDFAIGTGTYWFEGGSWWQKYLDVNGRPRDSGTSNRLQCIKCIQSASALPRGKLIGSKDRFDWFASMVVIGYATYRTERSTWGNWVNVSNRYLGLQFHIKGRVHYGWARLSTCILTNGIAATLTGYAYETIPNKPIIAGKTKGPDVITVQPGSLGRLAQGSAGLADWQKRELATESH